MPPSAFQAKNGITPEWQMVYDALLDEASFGDVITFADLDAALGRAFETNRSPIYRAREELGDRRHRWLEAVPRVGYRVVEAREHMRLARRHRSSARRQLGKMVRVTEVTDLSALTPGELAAHDSQAIINFALFSAVMSHEGRLRRVEEALKREGML